MHTKQELQNNVITTTNGNSGSVVTIKRSSGFESVLPSITSTPFVMSNRGTNTQNLKNNMISTNESNFIVTHNHIPDFLDSYMENIPINTLSSTLTSNASLHESQSKLLAPAPENANKFANGEEKEAIASAT
ncbi:hypothetical protein O3M35_000073 [Rhynocoris fuscipes]|uniref:Uncharacterized protein n=1 Tax=Rhynocoris fuscipes TaxID=488301 RepID=A0AAW1DM79_9HEMI